MSPAISFWRLTWKEYRTQRSLWLSVLILTALIQICIAVVATLSDPAPITGAGYAAIAFISVAVYMLGCGATLFALEHETGSYDFQRLLPVSVWQMYGAKLGVSF